MTEADWDACAKAEEMLSFLPSTSRLTWRKTRLFRVALCRRLWHLLEDGRTRKVVEILEQYADGRARVEELVTAVAEAFDTEEKLGWFANRRYAAGTVLNAAYDDGFPEHRGTTITEIITTFNTLDAAESATAEAGHAEHCHLLRDLVGNPFRPLPPLAPEVLSWHEGIVQRLARSAYEYRLLPEGVLDPDCIGILADAVEEAGCKDEQILTHLRSGERHYRGCFVVDAILSKA